MESLINTQLQPTRAPQHHAGWLDEPHSILAPTLASSRFSFPFPAHMHSRYSSRTIESVSTILTFLQAALRTPHAAPSMRGSGSAANLSAQRGAHAGSPTRRPPPLLGGLIWLMRGCDGRLPTTCTSQSAPEPEQVATTTLGTSPLHCDSPSRHGRGQAKTAM